MSTSNLTDGAYYWVRPAPGVDWEPAHYLDGSFWFFGANEQAPAAEVGPQLTPPE